MDLIEEWTDAWAQAGITAEKMAEIIRELSKAVRAYLMEAMTRLMGCCQDAQEIPEDAENKGLFDHEPTARKKKRKRDQRMEAERMATVHFRQCRARETSRNTRKRTGQRQREWRGPRKEK